MSILAGDKVELSNLAGNSFTPQNGAFTIGVSKRARMIFKGNNYPINYQIVRVDFDCNIKRGSNLTLRIYQQARESLADSVVIEASDTGYSKDIDVLLTGTYGARNLIADFWDPATSGALNTGMASGLLTIYGRPSQPVAIGDYIEQ